MATQDNLNKQQFKLRQATAPGKGGIDAPWEPIKGVYDVHHAETDAHLGRVSKRDKGWSAATGDRTLGSFPSRREAAAEVWIQGE